MKRAVRIGLAAAAAGMAIVLASCGNAQTETATATSGPSTGMDPSLYNTVKKLRPEVKTEAQAKEFLKENRKNTDKLRTAAANLNLPEAAFVLDADGTPGAVVKEGTDLSAIRAQGVRPYIGPRSYAELQALQSKAMAKPVPNMSAGIDVRKNVVRVEAPAAFWESANGKAVAAMTGIEKVVAPAGQTIRPVSMQSGDVS